MTPEQIKMFLTAWITQYCGISDDPDILTDFLELAAIPTASRTSPQQALWKQLNSYVVDYGQNGPRPKPPYITTHFQLFQKQGSTPFMRTATTLNTDNSLNNSVIYVDKVFLYLQSYGYGSDEYLQNLEQSLLLDSVQLYLLGNSITSLSDSGGITDIHKLIDSTIEERYSYDITFLCAQKVTDVIQAIQEVEDIGSNVSY